MSETSAVIKGLINHEIPDELIDLIFQYIPINKTHLSELKTFTLALNREISCYVMCQAVEPRVIFKLYRFIRKQNTNYKIYKSLTNGDYYNAIIS